MILRPADPSHYPWIAQRAKLCIGPEFRAIEVVDGDRLLAMCGFDGWTPSSVSMHVAVESPIALRLLVRQAFGIAFAQFKKRVVTVTVLSTNARSLALVEHLGFRRVFTGKDYWDEGVDLTVWEMRREDCKYLDPPRNAAPAAAHHEEREAA